MRREDEAFHREFGIKTNNLIKRDNVESLKFCIMECCGWRAIDYRNSKKRSIDS